METDFPDIYAAGDAAAAPSFFDGHHQPCPILPEAVLQGRVAGTNMAGGRTDYKGWIQCNALRCFEDNLFSMGMIDGGSDAAYQTIEKEEPNGFLRLVLKDERLVGAEGLNVTAVQPGVFLFLIRERIPVGKQRDLLLSKPKETACWLMQQWRNTQAV
jgi:NADPH-dependent 2,4-dienoyl-CoA reductase/sulfur reductase-like enzyme